METDKEQIHSSWLSWCCLRRTSSSFLRPEREANGDGKHQLVMVNSNQIKPGGWKSMPFILGNETFERLATFGVLANFMVYLRREYHMDQVTATNVINIFSGVSNFAPLLGAFLSDAFIGRFWAIAFGSLASFLGMLALTLTASIPSLTPPWCPYNDHHDQISGVQQMSSCLKANGVQLGFLVLGLGLLCIGTAGIRPCSIPFGMDQFDHTTEEGRRGINSYYNWYYTTFTIVVMLTLTVVVYIQDSVSWVWGFGIPTMLMFCSILLFFFGMRLFVYVKPQGSIFSSIFRVLVAAYKKRHLELPHAVEKGVFHDPPPSGVLESILPLTHQFSFLNKAAIIREGELNIDTTPTPASRWSLCSIQEVEEVKCVIRVLPIWASGIICFTAAAQQSTFAVSQAMIMNRNIGPKFQIPPGSIGIISMLAIGVWVPIYDRFLVPSLRKITKHEHGFTLLQRMGIGLVFSIISMVVAGLVEQKRRNTANIHHQRLSIIWLVPQLVMLGLAEGFNFIAQIEFYNKQFPENLRSIATSMFFITVAGASYLSSAVVNLVHKYTSRHGKPDWLTNDINQGRVDFFYYLLAIMGVLNFIYFIICARKYKYKILSNVNLEVKEIAIVDLNRVKH
ncbi:protein NRT1/ PTR FAMILY 2.12 [Beta vulgaris subsp. vulgaris]|uniref:protein NRT1/ PTR FAMILY 2.12 n=1 Tax=Beta vulgaris subsp. vulgaris TaxID=3555 RepID=UPI002036E249|nr:protein NRT1/ PTR FAMILY 2.12 [Beta vulgaris subsp. vulgaris]